MLQAVDEPSRSVQARLSTRLESGSKRVGEPSRERASQDLREYLEEKKHRSRRPGETPLQWKIQRALPCNIQRLVLVPSRAKSLDHHFTAEASLWASNENKDCRIPSFPGPAYTITTPSEKIGDLGAIVEILSSPVVTTGLRLSRSSNLVIATLV